MLLLIAGVTVTKMENIGEELKEIVEKDILLIETITEITGNQLEQAILFERALRYSGKMAISELETKAFEYNKEKFKKLSHLVNQELKDAEKITEKTIKAAVSDHARKEFIAIDVHLKVIEKEHMDYEQHVLNVFELLEARHMQEAFELAEKVEEQEDQLKHELRQFLMSVEKFTEESLLITKHEEESAVRLMQGITLFSFIFA